MTVTDVEYAEAMLEAAAEQYKRAAEAYITSCKDVEEALARLAAALAIERARAGGLA